MDSKELRGLYEAYSEVYAPQEVDEAITSEKGKAKAAEMIAKRTHASGRAKAGQGASVAAIKHISRANVDGYGGTPPNLKVAKNPVKSNFTGLNTGTGNKAARRAAALNKEEFDIFDLVLEFLQAEGFAETLEEAEWMMANVIDEEAIDIILGEGVPLRGTTPDGKPWRVDPSPSGARQPAKMERNPKERKSPKEGDYKSKLKKSDRYEEVEYRAAALKKEEFELWVNALVEEGYDLSDYTWDEMYEFYLDEDNVNEIFGLGGKSAKDRLANSDYMKKKNKEADEKAIQNLRNMMSKDPERQKRPSRINNEGYQRNPEKGEKEDKKYAPVRGEKTPMPPRGDKRREDFEKWYAKQMGR